MKVKEIEDGKKACVLIDCGQAHVYYPKPGDEAKPDAECNCARLEYEEGDEDMIAMHEASVILDIPSGDIELAHG